MLKSKVRKGQGRRSTARAKDALYVVCVCADPDAERRPDAVSDREQCLATNFEETAPTQHHTKRTPLTDARSEERRKTADRMDGGGVDGSMCTGTRREREMMI